MDDDKQTPETISDLDKMTMEMAKMNRKLAVAMAEKALAQTEVAELSHKYLLLQLYVKYGLSTTEDALDEQGNIVRGKKAG